MFGDVNFHLAAFYASLAMNTSYGQLLAVADGALPQNSASQYLAPANCSIRAAHVQGVTTFRGQVQAPSLRNVAYPEIYPIVQAAITTIPDNFGYQVLGDNGPRLLMNEGFGVYASENNTGASPTVAALLIGDRLVPPPPGPMYTLVATATITTVAQAWALGTLSFVTQLAAGEYTVVGGELVMDNINYWRLLFPGSANWRPGAPAIETYARKNWRDSFRYGRFGRWGKFQFNAPPQLEVFGSAAASTPGTLFLDVVKTG